MRLYLRLAWRNIWRYRRRTLIVVVAIGFALALMMWYDGLIAGFDQAIYGNAIKVLGGNIQVYGEGYHLKTSDNALIPLVDDKAVVKAALDQPQVLAATRRITTGGLATSREGAFAVEITGIEPELEKDVNLAAQHVIAGRYLTSTDADMILIGKGLAEAMAIQTNDRITLVGQATHAQTRQRTMTVAGIFDLGMPDLEKRTIYVSLSEAQDLYGLTGQTTEVAIVLKQLGEEGAVIAKLRPMLPGYEIDSWETNFPELRATINTKTGVMNIFGVIMILIAAIGILNMLLMAVYERTREIGLLGAMGMKPRQISFLFILEGTLMGLVGVAAGIVLGLSINGLFKLVGLDFTQYASLTSYMALISDRVYPTWGVDKLLWRSLIVAVISALAAFYPAHEASRREPADALHFV